MMNNIFKNIAMLIASRLKIRYILARLLLMVLLPVFILFCMFLFIVIIVNDFKTSIVTNYLDRKEELVEN